MSRCPGGRLGTFFVDTERYVDLSDNLKDALGRLGDNPTPAAVTDDLIRQLISQGLIEKTPSGGIRFTDLGKQVFRDLRGTWPKRNV